MFDEEKRYQLLGLINELHQRPKLEEVMKLSKSTIKRYCDKLKEKGLIKKRPKTNPIWYELTRAGIKELEHLSSIFSEGGEDWHTENAKNVTEKVWLLHHFALKYSIIEDYPLQHFNIEVDMNNWIKKMDEWKHCTVEKTTKHVIIHVKQQIGSNPFELEHRARNIADNMVSIFEGHYGMKFGRPIQVGKPHYETNDPLCQQFTKHFTVKYNDGLSTVRMDASRLGGEIGFDNPEDAVEYMRMPKRVKIMEVTVNRMDKKLDKEFSDLKETIQIIRNNGGVLADGMNLILDNRVKPNEKYIKKPPEEREVGYQ